MALGGKTILKSAFKTTRKLENAEADFGTAEDYGPILLGQEALYLFNHDEMLYIPLNELASIEVRLAEPAGGGSCNLVGVTVHDLSIQDVRGNTFPSKIIRPEKIDRAVEQILKTQPTLSYQVIGVSGSCVATNPSCC